jgi:hypothetical protein
LFAAKVGKKKTIEGDQMASTVTCPKCGTENHASYINCRYCGINLKFPVAKTIPLIVGLFLMLIGSYFIFKYYNINIKHSFIVTIRSPTPTLEEEAAKCRKHQLTPHRNNLIDMICESVLQEERLSYIYIRCGIVAIIISLFILAHWTSSQDKDIWIVISSSRSRGV